MRPPDELPPLRELLPWELLPLRDPLLPDERDLLVELLARDLVLEPPDRFVALDALRAELERERDFERGADFALEPPCVRVRDVRVREELLCPEAAAARLRRR